ncbi:MAG: hypothetical protein CMI85_02975 [Candidatus Pelagibacter sp.]|nr:hypothetical protein [Candidatus Pelagibacter sp.]|tara:strand:- start:1169 stop:2107 length:939 start_codon:yes stop_codon:yes gene_type:complete
MKFNINEYLEKINCPGCGCSELKILRKSNYEKIKNYEDLLKIYKSSGDELLIDQLSQCKKCGLVFLNPRIKSKIIYKSYTENLDQEHISQDNQRYKTFYKSLTKIIERNNIKNYEKKKFLDVGCASGIFLKVLQTFKFHEEGYEPSKWMTEYGKKNYLVNINNGSIDNINIKKKYDFISFWDVLEHVTDLQKTLNKINLISKDNCILIINVPVIDSLACKILKNKWPFYLNVHLYYFTEKTLKDLFKKKNFYLQDKFPHYQYLNLDYLLFRASKYFSFFEYIHKIVKNNFLGKISIPYNVGQTTFIFKKNEI